MDDKYNYLHGWIFGMFVLENLDKNFSMGRITLVDYNAKGLQSPSWTMGKTFS